MKLCVVVPVYKSNPDNDDIISLRQCIRILYQHDIYFICPEGLQLQLYEKVINEIKSEEQRVFYIRFPAFYFYTITGYNQLMLSKEFYKKFIAYQYILIYQLDAYIFRDDLISWCNKGYDYIGAPWINWFWSEHYARYLTLPRKFFTKFGYTKYNLVGNGGFSLRKTASFIQNLSFFGKQARSFKQNEDYFFSFYITSYNPFFSIPSVNEALNFAFDENPEQAWNINNQKLPMGCHAWTKYKSFWNSYIKTE